MCNFHHFSMTNLWQILCKLKISECFVELSFKVDRISKQQKLQRKQLTPGSQIKALCFNTDLHDEQTVSKKNSGLCKQNSGVCKSFGSIFKPEDFDILFFKHPIFIYSLHAIWFWFNWVKSFFGMEKSLHMLCGFTLRRACPQLLFPPPLFLPHFPPFLNLRSFLTAPIHTVTTDQHWPMTLDNLRLALDRVPAQGHAQQVNPFKLELPSCVDPNISVGTVGNAKNIKVPDRLLDGAGCMGATAYQ
jgi:hypothetical protein